MTKRIIPTLVRHYAEDASFLWILREKAIRSPNKSVEDIVALDERLEAQLDGLRVAGDAGWTFCQEELLWKEPGEIFVGGTMALESRDAKRLEAVAEAAASAPGLPRALIGSLAWLPWVRAQPIVESLSRSEISILRFAAVGAAAVRRKWMPDLMFAALKDDTDSLVLARALKTCGELGRRELLPLVEKHLAHLDEGCRFWATWSSLLLGRNKSRSELFDWAKKPGPFRAKALALAIRSTPQSEAQAWLDGLGEKELRLQIQGMGWLGAASRIPWLLQQTRKPEMARQAASAITWITGVEFLSGGLGVLPPPSLEQDLEEQGLAEAGDTDLNWPEPDKTEAWWKEVGKKFDSRKLYLLGRAKGMDAFQSAAINGKQCYRIGAALEMGILNTGKPIPEFRARS